MSRRPPLLSRWLAGGIARLYLRRPELQDAIAIRYRSVRAFVLGIANEFAYRLGCRKAGGLVSLNLELTNHCNLTCSFCPTGNGLLKRPRGFMRPETFRRALQGAGPLEFTLLFQWGEPLLHPQFRQLASEAKAHGTRTLVTTNATLLDDRRVDDVLDAGVDRVTISVDGDATTHERVRGVALAKTVAGIDRLRSERDRRGADTAIDVSMVIAPETESASASFVAAFEGRVDRVQQIPLLTQGTRRTRCREPWRGGLVVLQDGAVTVCCVDHDGVLAIGHVDQDKPKDLWNGAGMQALRAQHVCGDVPEICARCTEYPTDAAAPRFSSVDEASRQAPHQALPNAGRRDKRKRRRIEAEALVRSRRASGAR